MVLLQLALLLKQTLIFFAAMRVLTLGFLGNLGTAAVASSLAWGARKYPQFVPKQVSRHLCGTFPHSECCSATRNLKEGGRRVVGVAFVIIFWGFFLSLFASIILSLLRADQKQGNGRGSTVWKYKSE
jgi:hypothetical protein